MIFLSIFMIEWVYVSTKGSDIITHKNSYVNEFKKEYKMEK